MRKTVSPMFALIVIIVALVIGALYFAMRYRKHEAEEAALAAVLQAQANQARSSGRAQRGMSRGLRGRPESPDSGQGAAVPGRSATEGRPEEPESAD
jgi:type II secretory pathway pseudopilin PulG